MKYRIIAFLLFFWCGANAQITLTSRDANRIAQQIAASLGAKEFVPNVIFENNEDFASVHSTKILIDSNRVIAKLAIFGDDADDALAVIIGHEIWHILKGHQNYGFACWEGNSKKKKIETEADRCGLLLAFFAGYKHAMKIYDKIFDALQLPASPCYPSNTERQENDRKVKKQALEITKIYDAGNTFLANGSPEFCDYAIACYRHCGNSMLFVKELNYQIGLAWLFWGMHKMSKLTYRLPLPMQPSPYDDLIKADVPVGKRLLDSAEYYFRLALRQDSTFFDAELGRLAAGMFRRGAMPALDPAWQKRCSDYERRKADLLKAVYLLYTPTTESQGVLQLQTILNADEADDVEELASDNLSILEKKTTSAPPRFDIKKTDGIHDLLPSNGNLFTPAFKPIRAPGQYAYLVLSLKSSDVFLWKEGAVPRAILQTCHTFPAKNIDTRDIIPMSRDAGGASYYFTGTDYDVLIRPSEIENQIRECIKIIYKKVK